MFNTRGQSSWIDQFVLRAEAPGGGLAPFAQAMTAARILERVADDRTGLTRPTYDAVGTARYQAVLLADFLVQLESDFRASVRSADTAVADTSADASSRARALMASLSGAIEATATLTEVCHALLGVAEHLQVISRPKSRIELMAAVEGLRAAASTAVVTVQTNLDRITDAVRYDRLLGVVENADQAIGRADRISTYLRAATAPSQSLPRQRQQAFTGGLFS